MGQSISRRVVPFLQRSMQRKERETAREAIEEVAEKKRQALSLTRYSDPSSLLGGFTRGLTDNVNVSPDSPQSRLHREMDARQEDYLKQNSESVPDEMPEDLLKFITDLGPAKRAVDESRTSERILKKGEESGNVEGLIEDLEKEERNRRRQIWATHTAANTAMIPEEEGEKHSSSNQSLRKDQSFQNPIRDESENQILFKEEHLTTLFQNIQTEKTSDNLISDPKIDDATFEKISRYISYPVIMKDTDDELVGAWADKVVDLKRIGLKVVYEGSGP